MNNVLRSLFIEGVLGKNSSFLAKNALETHCFVLGGNEFRLRVLVCDAKRWFEVGHRVFKYKRLYEYLHR